MLKNKTVVITGAGSGVGRATARLFAGHGARVVVVDRDGAAAATVAQELPQDDNQTHAHVQADVAAPEDVCSLFDGLTGVDVLVNSAGVREIKAPLELTLEEFEHVVGVNLTGTFLCSQQAAKRMVGQGSGSIINVSSVGALAGVPLRAAYSATKAGILGLTRSLSQDLAAHGVRVNAVCPGLIRTPLTEGYFADESFVERLKYTIPMGRPGTAEDVAQALLYLASDMSAYVTGTTLTVDGGFMAAASFDPMNSGTWFQSRDTLKL